MRTTVGVHRLLDRLGFHWNRAREYLHSPDPHYQAKRERIAAIWQRVQASGGREVLLYQDECNYYRQPTLSQAYCQSGKQPLARRGYRSDTMTRVCAVLDATRGRVLYLQAPRLSVSDLASFYRRVREAYPQVERIWIVQDNNPVHFHPNLLVALEPQENPFPVTLAPNWSNEPKDWARQRFGHWKLPIQLVPLPTYASWCNPIEKLWRKFKQEIIHLHRLGDNLEALRQRAVAFFDQFAAGSAELLHYVGLGLPT